MTNLKYYVAINVLEVHKVKRKMSKELLKWKLDAKKSPLILYGARQVGKTYTILSFGKENYKNVAYINFEDDTELSKIFDTCDNILLYELNLRGDTIERVYIKSR